MEDDVTPYEIESLHNARRMAKRGLKMAQANPVERNYVDCFQHILDELALAGIKKEESNDTRKI